ncbi:MAG: hypothetical protein IJV04_08190 [Lachnospiraceae bacterium]|nr:hypothetical protein [Lachnospiraceae bacterium]
MGMFFDGNIGVSDERIPGICTGLVKDNYDAEHPGMVKVDYFLGEDGKNMTGWVPVMSPYAFKNCGAYAMPEVGAEVVIAFNMGDRNCPIVIGCLWNKKNEVPKQTSVEGNKIKRFLTKGGCEVEFNDDQGKESIEIRTPGKLSVRIDDDKKSVVIADKDKKNSFTLKSDEDSVTIVAGKKLTLQAGSATKISMDPGSVSIKAEKVNVEAQSTASIKGVSSVKVNGAQVAVTGSSSLDLKSSGMTQVKGSLVKLN